MTALDAARSAELLDAEASIYDELADEREKTGEWVSPLYTQMLRNMAKTRRASAESLRAEHAAKEAAA